MASVEEQALVKGLTFNNKISHNNRILKLSKVLEHLQDKELD